MLLLTVTFLILIFQPVLRETKNVLFGKPCGMNDTYSYFYAYRAVDGIKHGFLEFSDCAHTDRTSWWVCDMQNFYQIDYVIIYLRDNTVYAYLMDFFIVGLSNNSYDLKWVNRGSYPICYKYPKKVASGDVLTLPCERPTPLAKNLLLQQNEDSGYMTVCEIEAYPFPMEGIMQVPKAKEEGKKWTRIHGYYQMNFEVARMNITKNYQECFFECFKVWNCKSINIIADECVLNEDNASSIVVKHPSCTYYRLY